MQGHAGHGALNFNIHLEKIQPGPGFVFGVNNTAATDCADQASEAPPAMDRKMPREFTSTVKTAAVASCDQTNSGA